MTASENTRKVTAERKFFMLFAENLSVVISSSVIILGVGCVRGVVALEVDWKKIAVSNIRLVEISKWT